MVAEGVLSVGVKEFNVGRAFAHCTKLTKSNYDVWLTGLISTLVGITGISSLRDVRKFFEYFEDSRRAGQEEAKIEANLKQLLDQVLKLEANKEDDDGDPDAEDKTGPPRTRARSQAGHAIARTNRASKIPGRSLRTHTNKRARRIKVTSATWQMTPRFSRERSR